MTDFWLHTSLFVVVNAVYLVVAWPLWLWVTGFWTVGLLAHALLVFLPAGRRLRSGPGADRGA